MTVAGALVILFSPHFDADEPLPVGATKTSIDIPLPFGGGEESTGREEEEGGLINWRFISGFFILLTASVLYSLYLVLAKKFVFLLGPPHLIQTFESTPLSFFSDGLASLFSSPTPPSSSPPLSPSLHTVNENVLSLESGGVTPVDIHSVDVDEETLETDRDPTPISLSEAYITNGLSQRSELPSQVPIGVCGRWASTPIALTGGMKYENLEIKGMSMKGRLTNI